MTQSDSGCSVIDMGKRGLQLRTHQAIALILIGLMSGGALLSYLSSRSAASVCLEERVLESEDALFDFLELDLIQPKTIGMSARPQISFVTATVARFDPCAAHQTAHLQRGPPRI